MRKVPTFSVLVPAYNAGRTIAATLRSVLLQTRDDFQVIVVDDGSTDDTYSEVRRFDDLRIVVIRQPNGGLSAARNAGLAQADGEYVCLLDSDDLWLPTYLEVMSSALTSQPQAPFAYPDAWALDDKTGRISRPSATARQRPPHPLPSEAPLFLHELLRRNFIFGSAMIRRTVLDTVGPFRNSLRSAEDYELWLRILAHGRVPIRVPQRLAICRRRAGSLSSNEAAMLDALAEVYRIVAEEHPIPTSVRSIAIKRRELALSRRAIAESKQPLVTISRAGRRLVGRTKRALLAKRLWYVDPPPEVAAVLKMCE